MDASISRSKWECKKCHIVCLTRADLRKHKKVCGTKNMPKNDDDNISDITSRTSFDSEPRPEHKPAYLQIREAAQRNQLKRSAELRARPVFKKLKKDAEKAAKNIVAESKPRSEKRSKG